LPFRRGEKKKEKQGTPNEKILPLSAAPGPRVLQMTNSPFPEFRFREVWTPLLKPIFNQHLTKQLSGSRESA
jgi:hypothetical protein